MLVDPVPGRLAAGTGALVDGGKDAATAFGAGKEVGAVIEGVNAGGLLGQRILCCA